MSRRTPARSRSVRTPARPSTKTKKHIADTFTASECVRWALEDDGQSIQAGHLLSLLEDSSSKPSNDPALLLALSKGVLAKANNNKSSSSSSPIPAFAFKAAFLASNRLFAHTEKLSCRPLALEQLSVSIISASFAAKHLETTLECCSMLLEHLDSSLPPSEERADNQQHQIAGLYVQVYILQSACLVDIAPKGYLQRVYETLEDTCLHWTKLLSRRNAEQGSRSFENMYRTALKCSNVVVLTPEDALKWRSLSLRLLLLGGREIASRVVVSLRQSVDRFHGQARSLQSLSAASALVDFHSYVLSALFEARSEVWCEPYERERDMECLQIIYYCVRAFVVSKRFDLAGKALTTLSGSVCEEALQNWWSQLIHLFETSQEAAAAEEQQQHSNLAEASEALMNAFEEQDSKEMLKCVKLGIDLCVSEFSHLHRQMCGSSMEMDGCLSVVASLNYSVSLEFSLVFELGSVLFSSDIEHSCRALKAAFSCDHLNELTRCVRIIDRCIDHPSCKSLATTVFNMGILLYNRSSFDAASSLLSRAAKLYSCLLPESLQYWCKSVRLSCMCHIRTESDQPLFGFVEALYECISSQDRIESHLPTMMDAFVKARTAASSSASAASYSASTTAVDLLQDMDLDECSIQVLLESELDALSRCVQPRIDQRCALVSRLLSLSCLSDESRAQALLVRSRLSLTQSLDSPPSAAAEDAQMALHLLLSSSPSSSSDLQAQAHLWIGLADPERLQHHSILEALRIWTRLHGCEQLCQKEDEHVVWHKLALRCRRDVLPSSSSSSSSSVHPQLLQTLRHVQLLTEVLTNAEGFSHYSVVQAVLLQLHLSSSFSSVPAHISALFSISALLCASQTLYSVISTSVQETLTTVVKTLQGLLRFAASIHLVSPIVELASVYLCSEPSSSTLPSSQLARSLAQTRLSQAAELAQDMPEALWFAEMAIKSHTSSSEDGISCVQHALVLCKAFVVLGRLSEQCGDHHRALYMYQRCVEAASLRHIHLQYIEALTGIARIHVRRHEIAAAEAVLEKLKKANNHDVFLQVDMLLLKGDISRLKGDLQLASQQYSLARDALERTDVGGQRYAVALFRTRRREAVIAALEGRYQETERIVAHLLNDDDMTPHKQQAGALQEAHLYLVRGRSLLGRIGDSKVHTLWSIDAASSRAPSSRTLVHRCRSAFYDCIRLCHSSASPSLLSSAFMGLASIHGRQSPKHTACFLNMAISITPRNDLLSILHSKHHLQSEKKPSLEDIFGNLSLESSKTDDQHLAELLRFEPNPEAQVGKFMNEIVPLIPEGWSVLTIARSQSQDALLISRLQYAHDPVVLRLPVSDDGFIEVLAEFDAIISESKASTAAGAQAQKSVGSRREWWRQRRALDRRLGDVVDRIENEWLDAFKGLFRCASADTKAWASRLASSHHLLQNVDLQLLQIVLGSVDDLSQPQLYSVLGTLTNHDHDNVHIEELAHTIRNQASSASRAGSSPPLILILGPTLQHLPWESMPICSGSSISRLPSLAFLAARLSSVKSKMEVQEVDPRRSFYVLNPSRDLIETQRRLERCFVDRDGWTGVVGEPPSKQQWTDALSRFDLFVYCGHNSGEQFCSSRELKRHNGVKATALLMGCSSGLLHGPGVYEPSGTALAYMVSGSPAVLGNLWDVTDADIDRFSESLLTTWLDQTGAGSDDEANADLEERREEHKEESIDLASAIPLSRTACKLRYLVGASPVCYGIPVRANADKNRYPHT